MELPAAPSSLSVPRDSASHDDQPAPDAVDTPARAADDEAAAEAARERYRAGVIPNLAPDARLIPLLAQGERLVAMRRSVRFDRRQPVVGSDLASGLNAVLYLTTRRLILTGQLTLALELDEIEDAILSGERLLLALKGGQGLSLDVTGPRLLRVEIAAARASARS